MATKTLSAMLERFGNSASERAYAKRLRALAKHLHDAHDKPSPGLALHRAEARTVLFQLEALGRVHEDVIDKDAFGRVRMAIKGIEDGLGAVDFHDGVLKKLGDGAERELRGYFLGRRAEACAAVEHRLAAEGWWAEGNGASDAIRSIVRTIADTRWPAARKERARIAKYYAGEAMELQQRLVRGRYDFHEIESGVHEVRRKLRWLSIVPASFDGLFVRREGTAVDPALATYVTPAVANSPFNRFPREPRVPEPIELEPTAFLALSWMIAELGGRKDRAQLEEAVLVAGTDLGDDPKAAAARVRKTFGQAPVNRDAMAKDVARVTKRFVRDGVLPKLAAAATK